MAQFRCGEVLEIETVAAVFYKLVRHSDWLIAQRRQRRLSGRWFRALGPEKEEHLFLKSPKATFAILLVIVSIWPKNQGLQISLNPPSFIIALWTGFIWNHLNPSEDLWLTGNGVITVIWTRKLKGRAPGDRESLQGLRTCVLIDAASDHLLQMGWSAACPFLTHSKPWLSFSPI